METKSGWQKTYLWIPNELKNNLIELAKEINANQSKMKKCIFSYRPTFIYLHLCDCIEDITNENFEFLAESDANSSGTTEYKIIEDGKVVFEYTIPVKHPEEEDLDLDELEGKILVREINVYNHQEIDAYYDEDESLEPASVYFGLAYNFDGVHFGDDEEDESCLELQEYIPEDDEEEERFFEYYQIIDGEPVRIEL